MRRRIQFVLGLGVLVALCAEPALAQRGARQGKKGGEAREQAVRPGKGPGPRGGPGAEMPGAWMERLRRMTPEQQERFLENNQRFRNLPPEQQARIRENLRRWNSLSPEEKREIARRDQIWRDLSPEERRRVREEIWPRWQKLSPERRQAIQRRLGALAQADEAERERLLHDEKFLEGLSGEERELLRDIYRLRLAPGPRQAPPTDSLPPL